jgi:hypothetical protein
MVRFAVTAKSDDWQVGMLHSDVGDPLFGVVVCRPSPPHDVLRVGEDRMEWRFPVAVPQDLTGGASMQRASKDLADHDPTWKVQPDQEISAFCQHGPRRWVLPLRCPPRSGTETVYVSFERRTHGPVRTMEERVDLHMRQAETLPDSKGQSGFA